MLTTHGKNRSVWFARSGALTIGITLCWGGISIAADVGEILVAAPLIFMGAVGIIFAATGRLPPRARRGRPLR